MRAEGYTRWRKGVALLAAQLDAGFGLLFHDRAAAETHLGGRVRPAPLGNIAKARPDGSFKHRLIQDLRNNCVNDAEVLAERQVLPRPVIMVSTWDCCQKTCVVMRNSRSSSWIMLTPS